MPVARRFTLRLKMSAEVDSTGLCARTIGRVLPSGWRPRRMVGSSLTPLTKLNIAELSFALRAIAEGIAGAERRAHIVLSGRYTDWQFRRDLAQLEEELPIPADQALPPPPTPDELVISTINNERRKAPPPPEKPVVVVMTGLDEERVRLFAKGKNVQNFDTFIGEIGAADLWRFARRPLDLDWLVEFWHSHGRLGSLTEMLEVCLAERSHRCGNGVREKEHR